MASSHTTTNGSDSDYIKGPEIIMGPGSYAELLKDKVRVASPSELNLLWRSLVEKQDISYSYDEGEKEGQDSTDETDEDDAMDSEVSSADEDALNEGDGDGPDDDDNPNVFFLNVTIDADGKAHCSAPDFDAYLSAAPLTKDGKNCLQELSSRGKTLRNLANWLEKNRQNFLKSRESSDLGENAWDECQRGEIPVNQEKSVGKSLADILEVHGSTFGKHIKNVNLKWEGVIVSLEILFSKEAHEAWAVSAYKNMPDKSPEELDTLARITGVDAETIKNKAK